EQYRCHVEMLLQHIHSVGLRLNHKRGLRAATVQATTYVAYAKNQPCPQGSHRTKVIVTLDFREPSTGRRTQTTWSC
ncbi:Hypothetical protein SMAX5B_011292, partial [Scophthalmus maximus]